MALAKEAGRNEKALQAALGDNSRPLSLIQACRWGTPDKVVIGQSVRQGAVPPIAEPWARAALFSFRNRPCVYPEARCYEW